MAVITTRLIELPVLRWRDRNVSSDTGTKAKPVDAPDPCTLPASVRIS